MSMERINEVIMKMRENGKKITKIYRNRQWKSLKIGGASFLQNYHDLVPVWEYRNSQKKGEVHPFVYITSTLTNPM